MRRESVIGLCLLLLLLGTSPQTATAQDQATGPQVSLSLHDALSLALANNLDYQAALTDERAAAEVAGMIHGVFLLQPDLSVGYSFFHTQSPGSFTFGNPPRSFQVAPNYLNNADAALSLTLFDGGKIQAQVGQAEATYAGAVSQLAASRATVIRDVTNAYFQLVQATRAAAVADQATGVAQQNLTTSQQLYRAGTAARADVLRQEVTLANARVQAIQAHNSAALANAQLANLLNINLGSIITPTEPLEVKTPAFSLDTLLAASQKRPELTAAQQAVNIASESVAIARSALLPKVNVTVQDASSKPNFENIPQPQLSETLALTWKLWDGGITRANIIQAQDQVDRAKIQLRQLENGVDLEVRQAYLTYQAAEAQVDAARTAQASAQESLRVSEIRYRAGVGTSLELSDALLASTQAQNQYINALASLRQALVAVQRAAGLLPETP